MTIEIPMQLHRLDLRRDDAYDSIHPELSELFWISNGPISLAVLFSDAPAPAAIADTPGARWCPGSARSSAATPRKASNTSRTPSWPTSTPASPAAVRRQSTRSIQCPKRYCGTP